MTRFSTCSFRSDPRRASPKLQNESSDWLTSFWQLRLNIFVYYNFLVFTMTCGFLNWSECKNNVINYARWPALHIGNLATSTYPARLIFIDVNIFLNMFFLPHCLAENYKDIETNKTLKIFKYSHRGLAR